MKTIFLSILIFSTSILFSNSIMAQNQNAIIGSWKGELAVSGTKLPLLFHIQKAENKATFSATMDSPAQGAKDIPVSEVIFIENNLTINMPNLGITYEAKLISETEIKGTFKQGGQSFPLVLNKIEKNQDEKETNTLNRPQEPKAPFDYKIEDVKFQNKQTKEETILAGTLTLPKAIDKNKKFPVVILISGSGSQNRNQEILGHKPFLVIADYFTNNGIAVLRYDDRGTAQSTGTFKGASSQDFATDVEAAIDYLKSRNDIDTKNIGLIGHSEGGMIAPMVAANRKKDIAFIVLLAGVGVNGSELLLNQQQAIGKASEMSDEDLQKIATSNQAIFELIKTNTDIKILSQKIKNYLDETILDEEVPTTMSKKDFINLQISQLTDEWLLYFLRYTPKENLSKVSCPVLAINGEKDLQVDAQLNLTAIANALKENGNKNVMTKSFPNLNHLFQNSETGLPSEYETLEETFSPLVLEFMKEWIEKQSKK